MPRNNEILHDQGKITPNELAAFLNVQRTTAMKFIRRGPIHTTSPPGSKDVHISARSAVDFCKEYGYPVPPLLEYYAKNFDQFFTGNFQPIND